MITKKLRLALLALCLMAGAGALQGANVLERVENPGAVEDWTPVLRQLIDDLPEGAVLHLPGPRSYRLDATLRVDRSLTLQLDPSAELVAGKGVAVLIAVGAPGQLTVEGTSGRAVLRNDNEKSSVFSFKTIPAGAAPDITMRRLHVVGYIGVDGTPDSGRYTEGSGSIGDWLIEDCHFENSERNVAHHRGTVGSLKVENSVFSGEPRMGLVVSSPIENGAYIRGKWLLTCDDSPVCRQIFAGLPMIEMDIKYSIGNRMSVPRQSGELLVMHPDLADRDNVVPFQRSCKARAA